MNSGLKGRTRSSSRFQSMHFLSRLWGESWAARFWPPPRRPSTWFPLLRPPARSAPAQNRTNSPGTQEDRLPKERRTGPRAPEAAPLEGGGRKRPPRQSRLPRSSPEQWFCARKTKFGGGWARPGLSGTRRTLPRPEGPHPAPRAPGPALPARGTPPGRGAQPAANNTRRPRPARPLAGARGGGPRGGGGARAARGGRRCACAGRALGRGRRFVCGRRERGGGAGAVAPRSAGARQHGGAEQRGRAGLRRGVHPEQAAPQGAYGPGRPAPATATRAHALFSPCRASWSTWSSGAAGPPSEFRQCAPASRRASSAWGGGDSAAPSGPSARGREVRGVPRALGEGRPACRAALCLQARGERGRRPPPEAPLRGPAPPAVCLRAGPLPSRAHLLHAPPPLLSPPRGSRDPPHCPYFPAVT